MTKYKYLHYSLAENCYRPDMMSDLKELGNHGWELVNWSGSHVGFLGIFKRAASTDTTPMVLSKRAVVTV